MILVKFQQTAIRADDISAIELSEQEVNVWTRHLGDYHFNFTYETPEAAGEAWVEGIKVWRMVS